MDQDPGTGAYLWTPELVEIAHTAYSMAKATKGLSFKEAVELILYAGEAAQHAKAGRSILTLLHQALDLPTRLEEAANDVVAAVADVRGAVGELRWVGRDIRRDVQQVIAGYQETLAEAAIGAVMEVGEVARDAREALRGASSGGGSPRWPCSWWPWAWSFLSWPRAGWPLWGPTWSCWEWGASWAGGRGVEGCRAIFPPGPPSSLGVWGGRGGLKVAQHLGGGGLPEAPSSGGTSPPFSRKCAFVQG
jgi:hypothetical protein